MSGGRFGSASGIRRTINATLSPFKSFRQITPSHRRHIPVRRERRIKGDGFLRASGRKVPAVKCRILKGGREGSFDGEKEIYTKWKVLRTSGRGLAVRFGPASWASLVREFCQLGGIYLLPGKFPSRCVVKRCICWGPSVLSKTRKQRSAFSKLPFSAGIWVVEATSE